MAWIKPEDLELVAELESPFELDLVRGLLESSGIECSTFTITDSAMMFAEKSIYGGLSRKTPFKVLVRPEDAEKAKEIIAATPQPMEEDGDE